MGLEMFVPTLLALGGLALCAFVAFLVFRGLLVAIMPNTWRDRWDQTSFITFAWHELGRSLFLGFVAAVGILPMTVAVFAGYDHFVFSVAFLSGVFWGTVALSIFFLAILSTFVGFLRYEMEHPERHSAWAVIQFSIVAVFSLPALFFLQAYLIPNLANITGLWFETMGLYAKVVQ